LNLTPAGNSPGADRDHVMTVVSDFMNLFHCFADAKHWRRDDKTRRGDFVS
jgi:hypothetical protein